MKSNSKRRSSFYLVLSIVVALGIWVYVDLTQGITASKEVYDIPIEFLGEDTTLAERGLMLLADSETTIDLKLEGTKSILAQLDTSKLRVQADLSAVTETGVQTVLCRVIYPEYKFSSGLTATTPTNSFNITIDVGELYSREVEIRCEIQGDVAEGYMAGELELTPEKLELRGPQAEVDAVSYAKVSLNIANATETVDQALPYVLYNDLGEPISGGDIHAVQDEIRVVLPVYVVKELALEVDFLEAPGLSRDNVSYRIEPSSIMVSGEASILNGIDRIVLDTFDLSQLSGTPVYNYVIQLPEGCSNLSGVTRAAMTISFIDMTSDQRTATSFQAENVPEGKHVTILTDELSVRIRGTAADVAAVQDGDITVVADLQEISGASGTYTVPAQILISTGGDVGVVGDYQVTVTITNAPADEPEP